MDAKLKNQISEGARQYINTKGMSQADFARYAGVGASYLSNILNDKFEYNAGGEKMVQISDSNFEMIARAIGMSLMVAYWRTVETPQFIEVIQTLENGKARGTAKMIIGETGCGKTYASDRFVKENPIHTYKITVSNQHKIRDVTGDIGEIMGVSMPHTKASRMRAISSKLMDIRLQGGKPQIIIDEAENMTHGMIGLTKGIYDGIREWASLVIIGTEELVCKLDWMQKNPSKYEGIPQFRRRFKAGEVHLTPIDRNKHFEQFFADVQDAELCKLLRGLCGNYGELHDFLEPAMREAAEDGVILTDQYFRTMYNIRA